MTIELAIISALTINLVTLISKNIFPIGNILYGITTTIAQVGLGFLSAYYLNNRIRTPGPHRFLRKRYELWFLWFAFVSITLGDLVYGSVLNVLMVSELRGTWKELVYNLPYSFFWISSSFVFLSILSRERKFTLFMISIIFTLSSIFLVQVYGDAINKEQVAGIFKLIHIVCMSSKALVGSAALIMIIFGKYRELRLFAAGYSTMIAYSLLLEYLEIIGGLQPSLPTEIFWTSGLLLIYFGLTKVASGFEDKYKETRLVDLYSLRSRLILISVFLSITVIVSWNVLMKFWPSVHMLPKFGIFASWLILVIVAFWVLTGYVESVVVRPLSSVVDALKSLHSIPSNSPLEIRTTGISEFDTLGSQVKEFLDKLRYENARNVELTKLATQMSHDIRSPLAALRMLISQSDSLAPEDTRIVVGQVAARIHVIADTLLEHKAAQQEESTTINCLVYPLLESILAEKRILIPADRLTLELVIQGNIHTKFAAISSESLGRIVSNLLNNSIEAFNAHPEISNPRITVFFTELSSEKLCISIQDNAGGIPPAVAESIRNGVNTTTKQNGNGIGLTHAAEALRNVGGTMDFLSQEGYGTVFSITVPHAISAEWMCDEIDLQGIKKVIVVDDDSSIHSIWRTRLLPHVEIEHFKSVIESKTAVSFSAKNVIWLIDYEFRGSQENGLNLIDIIDGRSACYLVTSQANDTVLHQKTKNLGIKILPKFLAPFVKIKYASNE